MVRRLMGVGLGMAILAASAAVEVQAQDDFEWSGEIAQGRTLEIRGISGNIRAVLASGDRAEVYAAKHGRSRDFDDVHIEVVEDGDGVIVCAVYGESRRGSCDYDGDDDGGHRRGRRSINVSVDFEVRVPAGVEFVGAMVSGDVRAEDLESEVTATTVSGDVFVSTTEVAWGTTVSGEIEIAMGSSDWDDLHFSTVSGDITLFLPSGLDADVEFSSLSGDFESDFDIAVESRSRRRMMIGSRVRGVIGDGGRKLSFNTVSGDVTLRRARVRVR